MIAMKFTGDEVVGKCETREQLPGDQNFRESFYNSGTDWSSLYENDEYGMPLPPLADHVGANGPSSESYCSLESVKAEKFLEFNAGIAKRACFLSESTCTDETKNSSRDCQLYSGGNTFACGYLRTSSCSSETAEAEEKPLKRSATKLVQSDLSSFLDLKPRIVSDRGSTSKRLRQQDIGLLFGIPPIVKNPVTEASFLSKFRRRESVVNGKSSVNGRGWKTSEASNSQTNRSCPFYKKIPGTPFTVDAFRYGEVEGCTGYFLTHFHYDHYGGLTKGWCHGPIYCTPVTANLVVLCLRVDPRWICILEIGKPSVIEGVEVTMLDANHCPGAALVYFRHKNGQNILHTGDFRACKEMQTFPELLCGKVSALYLDTTYCNPKYRFPLQQDVINYVIRQTFATLAKNPKTVVVVGSYSIGKERVYVSLAKALGVQVFADHRRRLILRSLDWPELATRLSMDAASTLLHVLPLSCLNVQKLKAYLNDLLPRHTAILAFRPTGWTYSEKVGHQLDLLKPQVSGPVTIYGVPYSEHSSFLELQEFVQFLRPQKVIPTVNNGKAEQRDKMQSFFRQWLA